VPPTSLLCMESVDAKIRRAKHHVSVLTSDLMALGRDHRPEMILKHDGPRVWLVVYYKSPYADLSHSTVFGDFLHNLRSSLDALVHGLIRRCGRIPRWNSSFPIYAQQASYERHTKPGTKGDVLAGLPDKARSLIQRLQPFMRGGRSVDLDPLHQLNVMYNHDKHEASHIMLGYAKEAYFGLHLDDGRVVQFSSDGPLIGYGPWEIPIPMSTSDVKPSHRIEARGRADFLIRTDEPWQGRPILDFAHTCLNYVDDHVVREFRPFFE
jgi:hypothetical protein